MSKPRISGKAALPAPDREGYYWLHDIHTKHGVPVMVTRWVRPDTWLVHRYGMTAPDTMTTPYHGKQWFFLGPLLSGVGNGS